MEKWINLLAQLEVIEFDQYGHEIMSLEELLSIEDELGIILPTGYKEFCQTFGTGMFGEFIGISCLTREWRNFTNLSVEVINCSLREFPERSNSSFTDLLNSALIFGGDDGSHIAFWDLRTYRISDESYDIYWASSEETDGSFYLIGRDFFEFVQEFCLGERAFLLLPETAQPLRESIYPTFTRSNSIGLGY